MLADWFWPSLRSDLLHLRNELRGYEELVKELREALRDAREERDMYQKMLFRATHMTALLQDPQTSTQTSEVRDVDMGQKHKIGRNWSSMRSALEKQNAKKQADDRAKYWKDQIEKMEEKDASEIGQAVRTDAGSGSRESQGSGSLPGSSEGVHREDPFQ